MNCLLRVAKLSLVIEKTTATLSALRSSTIPCTSLLQRMSGMIGRTAASEMMA